MRSSLFMVATGVAAFIAASCDEGGRRPPEQAADAGTTTNVPCSRAARFQTTKPLVGPFGVSPTLQFRIQLTADEKTAFFPAFDGGQGDLMMAMRPNDVFGPAVPVTELNTDVSEIAPVPNPDGRRILFKRAVPGGGYQQLVSQRSSTSDPFSPPVPVPGIFDDPYIAGEGASIYFLRFVDHAPMRRSFDIFRATRDGDGFTNPVQVEGINTEAHEGAHVVTADERMILWASNRDGGSFRIYEATRASTDEPFGNIRWVEEIAPSQEPTWLSLDGCRLYLMRATADPTAPEVFVATRGQ